MITIDFSRAKKKKRFYFFLIDNFKRLFVPITLGKIVSIGYLLKSFGEAFDARCSIKSIFPLNEIYFEISCSIIVKKFLVFLLINFLFNFFLSFATNIILILKKYF